MIFKSWTSPLYSFEVPLALSFGAESMSMIDCYTGPDGDENAMVSPSQDLIGTQCTKQASSSSSESPSHHMDTANEIQDTTMACGSDLNISGLPSHL